MSASNTRIQWSEKKVSLADLKPYERNPRRISKEQFERLKSSLEQNGYHQRLIVTKDLKVIGGHQRIRALTDLGFKEVGVLVPDRDLTEQEFRRLLVQDNLPFGEFDMDMLAADFDMAELIDWGMPPAWLQGIGGDEIPEEAAPIPDAPTKPKSVPGDIWVCGLHRVMCGDSTSADDVSKLLGTVKPNLMVTDPPYGVNYDANWRNEADRSNGKPYGASAVGKVANDDKSDWREAWALFPGNIAYIWHAGRHASNVQQSIEACGFEIRCQIIWAKTRFAISRGDYHWQHEPCWYAVRNKGDWKGDRSQSTLWTIDHQASETGHSTQKPVECMRRPIVNNSSVGQAVYDPFLGSGTTMIAAEQTGRMCYGMEINPAYVDVAVMRWQNLTGHKAINATTGKPFDGS